MEAVNGVSEVDKGGPPAPSPLTGCYLLIVVGEPHSKEHKDIILRRIAKGLLSWNASSCYVDLEKELAIISEQAPEGEDARYGERLIQFASENLVTEVLIHPAISTLSQCMKNLLSSFTRHRHIIHAGYTFAGNGSWILQDGTFSLTDFSEAFQEIDVQRVLRAYDNTISLDIHCSSEGDWSRLQKETFTKNSKVRVNPDDVLTSGSPAIVNFLNYISPFLIPTDIEMLLESSDVVGNIRFSHPTLYVFPGGQGDAALFGINGFNMLVDGGFARKACFWDFVRHLDRLDAVLLTRLNNSNVNGISSVLRRKRHNTVYPQIGHFFCNIQERKAILSPDGDKDKDPLIINLFEEGQDVLYNLRQLNLQPQPCYRDIEPINLYHKVGHGTLDMYILTPSRDSKEVKEFMQKWNSNDQRLFASQRNGKDFIFPTHNLVSICALLVWQPANTNDNITRILFPGSSPQHKIFEGLDKLKQLDCVKFPSCSAKSLTPNILKSKLTKTEKILQEQKEIKAKSQIDGKPKTENKAMEENMKNGQTNGITNNQTISEKIMKKHDSTESEKSGPQSIDLKKTEMTNGKPMEEKTTEKAKTKVKPDQKIKPEIKVSKNARSLERKAKPIEKKASPTTPKKTVETKMNGETTKFRPPAKTSPSATPAKSAKDANNRKVVESKYKVAPKKDISKPTEKKEPKPERKPISRRPKGTSPTGKVPESPIKKISELHKIETRKPKLEKECTTDSSTVSTPSADVETAMKKDLSKLTPEELEQIKARELAELKEEQEVVKEIEAVFRKSESKTADDSDMRKIKSISIDDKTEGEGEEYLIIEKEEIDHDSLDEKDAKESETQKHLRDSEESEKQRKLSDVMESTNLKDSAVETVEQGNHQDEEVLPTTYVKEEKEIRPISKEVSVTSPDDKIEESSGKKITDRDVDEENKDVNVLESQPDEKFSTPIESGATTAPTLPEDERIPLDEIKEDNGDIGVEEKYVKEDTKEKEIPTVQVPPKTVESTTKIPIVVGIRLDKQTPVRDIVKTPDEVADLPVHEEVDIENYEHYQATEAQTTKLDDVKLLTIKGKVNGVQEDVTPPEQTVIPDNEVGQKQEIEASAKHDTEKEEVVDDSKVHKDLAGSEDVPENVEVDVRFEKDLLKKEKADGETLDDNKKEDIASTELVDSQLKTAFEKGDEKSLKDSAEKSLESKEPPKTHEIQEVTSEIVTVQDVITKSTCVIEHVNTEIKDDIEEKITDSKLEAEILDNKEKCDMEKNILAKESELVAVITDSQKVDDKIEVEKIDEVEQLSKQVEGIQTDVSKASEELHEEDCGSKKPLADLPEAVPPSKVKTAEIATSDVADEQLRADDKNTEYVEDEERVMTTQQEADSTTATEKVAMSMEKTEVTVEKTSKHKDDTKIGKEAIEEDEKDQDTTEDLKPDRQEVVEEVQLSTEVQLVEAQQLIKNVKADIDAMKSDFIALIDDEEVGKSISKAFTSAGEMLDSANKTVEESIQNVHELDESVDHKEKLTGTEVLEKTVDKVEEKGAKDLNDIENVTKIGQEKEVEISSDINKEVVTVTVEKEMANDFKQGAVEHIYENGVDVESEGIPKELEEKDKIIPVTAVETRDEQKTPTLIEAVEKETADIEMEKTIEIKLEEHVEKESITIEQSIPSTVLEEVKEDEEEVDDKSAIRSVRADSMEISKIDKKLQELKESAESETKSTKIELELVDKMELGRKSPKEREQDVAIIVASVAEVLKSDAPLEEFEGKIPLEIVTFNAFTPFTTELRETHITTLESPIRDVVVESIVMDPIEEEKFVHADPTSLFINEERKVAAVHTDYDTLHLTKESTRVSSLLKDSTELIQATSKMISDIKQTTKADEHVDGEKLSEKGSAEVGTTEKEPLDAQEISKSPISSDKTSPDIKSAIEDAAKLTKEIVMSASEAIAEGMSDQTEKLVKAEEEILDKTSTSLEEDIKSVTEVSDSIIEKRSPIAVISEPVPADVLSEPSNLLRKSIDTDRDIKPDLEVSEKESSEHTSTQDTKPELEGIDIKASHDLKEESESEPPKTETKQEHITDALKKLSIDLKEEIVSVKTIVESEHVAKEIGKKHIEADDSAVDEVIKTDTSSAVHTKDTEISDLASTEEIVTKDDASKLLTQPTTEVEFSQETSPIAQEKDASVMTANEEIKAVVQKDRDDVTAPLDTSTTKISEKSDTITSEQTVGLIIPQSLLEKKTLITEAEPVKISSESEGKAVTAEKASLHAEVTEEFSIVKHLEKSTSETPKDKSPGTSGRTSPESTDKTTAVTDHPLTSTESHLISKDGTSALLTSVALEPVIECKSSVPAEKPQITDDKVSSHVEEAEIQDKSPVVSRKTSSDVLVTDVDQDLIGSASPLDVKSSEDQPLTLPESTDIKSKEPTSSDKDLTHSSPETKEREKSPTLSGKASPDLTGKHSSPIDQSAISSEKHTLVSKELEMKDKSPPESGETASEVITKKIASVDKGKESIPADISKLDVKDLETKDISPITSERTSPDVTAKEAPLLSEVVEVKSSDQCVKPIVEDAAAEKDSSPLEKSLQETPIEDIAPPSTGKTSSDLKETNSNEIALISASTAQPHEDFETEHKHDSHTDVIDKEQGQESEIKDRSATSSGRTSPSSIVEKVIDDDDKESVLSEKSTPETKEADAKEVSSDIKHTDVKHELILEQSHPEKVSKETMPETKDEKVAASRATPESVAKEVLQSDDKDSVLEESMPDVEESNAAKKSTDVKETIIDVKSSIELISSSESVTHEIPSADKNKSKLITSAIHDSEDTLEKSETVKEDKSATPSGKSTPDVQETIIKGKSQVSSGKSSPDLSAKETILPDKSFISVQDKSPLHSGKTSPDIIIESKETEVKASSPVPLEKFISVVDTPAPTSTQLHETSTSSRSSPEISELTKDLLDTKQSPILSRKSTPEIIIDNEFVISDRLTPDKDIETEREPSLTDVNDVATEDKVEHISQSTTELPKTSVEENVELKSTPITQSSVVTTEVSDIRTEDVSIAAEPSSVAIIKSHELTPSDAKEPAEIISEPGPSGRLATEIKTLQEELDSSRKSTPDIAITKDIETEDSLLGRTTPPTAPVSPIFTPSSDKQSSEKKDAEIPIGKTADLRSLTPVSDDCDISSGQVSRVLTTEDDDEKQVYSDDEEIPGSPLSATSQIAHSTSSQYDIEDSVRAVAAMDPMSTSFYGALPDESIDTVKETKTAHADDSARLKEATSSPSHIYEVTTAKFSSIHLQGDLQSVSAKSTLPETDLMTASFIGSELPTDPKDDPIASWEKPLGLPSPAPLNDNKGTPKKERKIPSNVVVKNKLNEDKKLSDSKYDKKGKKINPVYVDLTYVPHNGNSNYSYVDFFKRVRARYYVFSGIEPSREVYSALLEAKQTWDDKDLEVTIIPTYDTDVLGYWVAENEDLLAKHKIDLSPSASRCTINLQDHETSCSAYRLEFS